MIEKLQRIEALFAGAATPGERAAAAEARDRIRARLASQQVTDLPIEYAFNLRDPWSHKLMLGAFTRTPVISKKTCKVCLRAPEQQWVMSGESSQN